MFCSIGYDATTRPWNHNLMRQPLMITAARASARAKIARRRRLLHRMK